MSVPYLSPAQLADAMSDPEAAGLPSKRARKRINRELLKAGALILPHEEARFIAPARTYADGQWEALDRRIGEALARCEASEQRTLAWISNTTGSGAPSLTSGPVSDVNKEETNGDRR